MAVKTSYTYEQAKALCDLFSVLPDSYVAGATPRGLGCSHPVDNCLAHGFMVVDSQYNPISVPDVVFDIVDGLYGIDPKVMTNTFYQNFKTVTEMTRWEIFVDQCIHYMGTYGMEALGGEPITIIPMRAIEVPDVDVSKVKVKVIRLAGYNTVTNLVNDLATETAAPSKRILNAYKELVPFTSVDLNDIQSFELGVIAFDHFQTAPRAGKQFLRFLIYKMTGSTLVIKNQRTVGAIKASTFDPYPLLSKANQVELARIFLRYKPLFLALKSKDGCAPIINKLRRMADTYHEPLSPETLQNYIEFALKGHSAICTKLLADMTTRDMVKLLNAMMVRFHAETGDPAVYNVRNGRSYVVSDKMVALNEVQKANIQREIRIVYGLLVEKLRHVVEGKNFLIPFEFKYAVPHTEKQFVGNLPWGTTIIAGSRIEDPMTIGVSWFNQGDYRVDLDLHAFTPSEHFGWNAAYCKEGGTVIYSGDMTNAPAPNGAAEAFWIEGVREPVIFDLNEFCGPAKVPFKLYLSANLPSFVEERDGRMVERYGKDYCMDPAELACAPIPMEIGGDTQAMTLGYYMNGAFTFYSGNLSNSAVPKGDYKEFIKAITTQQSFHMNLADLLCAAGANVFGCAEDIIQDGEAFEAGYIDLSPDKLTATTLMGIVDGKLPE